MHNNNSNGLELYIKGIKEIPLLTREEEKELGKKIQRAKNNDSRDTEAINKLVEHNQRYVMKIAISIKRNGGRDYDLMELINQGIIGMYRAAESFNPARECKFITYANKAIIRSIWGYIANNRSHFFIGETDRKRLNKAKERLAEEKKRLLKESENRNNTIEEIANEVGMASLDLEFLLSSENTFSLDDENEYGDPYRDTIRSKDPDVDALTDEMIFHEELTSLIKSSGLPIREKKVIYMWFSLNGYEPHTLKEIADVLHDEETKNKSLDDEGNKSKPLSRERIRQIKNKGISRMKRRGRNNRFRLKDYHKVVL